MGIATLDISAGVGVIFSTIGITLDILTATEYNAD